MWSPAIEVHRGRAKKRVVTRLPEKFDLEKYAADIQSAAEGEAEEFEVAHNLRLLEAAIAEEGARIQSAGLERSHKLSVGLYAGVSKS